MKTNPAQDRGARAPLMERGMRLALFCLIAMAATPAFSQLIPMGETDAAVNYVDSTNVGKNGDMRSVWVILDLKKPSAAGARSIRALNEFQCTKGRFTTLASFDYAEPKAAGRILKASPTSDKWSTIAPDSVAGAIQELVCTN